jgi:creatinine amidohydrolase
MKNQPVILAQAHYKEIRNASYELAVLPWGATEAHNLHLPYGTDIIESERIAAEAARLAAARGAKIVVLPPVPFGVNTGQLDIPLTINMNPSTQMALLNDVASSLQQQGIRKLAILNGHGGNDFRQMIRELQPRFSLLFCQINWWICVDPGPFFREPGDHAGELETSVMLHLAPDLVLPLSEAGSGAERKPRISGFRDKWAWTPRQWTKVSADTGIGDPSSATEQKGKAYFAAVTEKIGTLLAELSTADPNDLYS